MRGKTLAGVIGLAILAAAGIAVLICLVLQPGRDAPSPPIRAEKEEEYPCPPAVKKRLSSTCYIGIDDKMYSSTDIDGDGLYDSDEIRWFGTLDYDSRTFMNGRRIDRAPQLPRRPEDIDTDKDTLPDAWEMGYFGDLSQGRDDDPDGDGFPNWIEALRRSSPLEIDLMAPSAKPIALLHERARAGEFSTDTREFWDAQERARRRVVETGTRQARPPAQPGFRWNPPPIPREKPPDAAAMEASHRQAKRVDETRRPHDERADSDADGLPDRWELDNLGHLNSGRNDDVDLDGLPNIAEYYLLTHPAKADLWPRALRPERLIRFRPTTHPWSIHWDIASREFWEIQDRLQPDRP
ncbi:MAG: hypothetical protein BWX88_01562 [Planctomycetes bacterium ADurb.Bin126]|nr:MAG: hypothetical protein BWX88_01562 [Planctomycetes bacterium ADurb.Bin126]HOD80397.1 hypothetical protein [Phycisphaerae bacterium]HQL74428.1 hypothetical protein [Phycisphaerae bacterium]